jgi:hypothetical protein
MNKNTMYLLGGVALVGLAYYLYNKNSQTTANNSNSFANLSSSECTACGGGYIYKDVEIINDSGKKMYTRLCVPCSNTSGK